MRVLIAPQEFKGTLTAAEAADSIATALGAAFPAWQLDLLPMADGGPGTVQALLAALGGESRRLTAHDALLRPVEAAWGLLSSGVAVVEGAAAAGLSLLAREELDVRRASTYGVGELIAAALEAGCRELIVGLGGSATNDAAAGMAQALGYRLLDANGESLEPGGASLAYLDRIDGSGVLPMLKEAHFVAPTDVGNPLCGPRGASAVFGPQKGATPEMVEELDAALAHFADVVERDLGVDVRFIPGAGAAGGSGAGAVAFLGARLISGPEMVAEAAHLEQRIRQADFVITGEGRLDFQTDFGKGPQYVARLARAANRPVLCVAGSLGPGHERVLPWFDVVETGTKASPAVLPSTGEAAAQTGDAAVRGSLLLVSRRGLS